MLHNLCLHFARQDGQDRKIMEIKSCNKVTKIPKTKRRKYGMNETQAGKWKKIINFGKKSCTYMY